jgi:hypothetical protein
MARYYSIQGNNLYVYATMGDSLIDLNTIPEGLGLFSAEVPWRLTPWAAVTEEAPEEGLRVAEILLRAEGYKRSTIDKGVLDEYFLIGDASLLPIVEPTEAEEVVPMHQWALDNGQSAQAKPRLRRPSMRRRLPKPTPLQRTSRD